MQFDENIDFNSVPAELFTMYWDINSISIIQYSELLQIFEFVLTRKTIARRIDCQEKWNEMKKNR